MSTFIAARGTVFRAKPPHAEAAVCGVSLPNLGEMNYPELGGAAPLKGRSYEREIALMKNTPEDFELSSEVIRISATDVHCVGRFQVIVEYTTGANVVTANVDVPEEGVEAFMQQLPGRKDGEISL